MGVVPSEKEGMCFLLNIGKKKGKNLRWGGGSNGTFFRHNEGETAKKREKGDTCFFERGRQPISSGRGEPKIG